MLNQKIVNYIKTESAKLNTADSIDNAEYVPMLIRAARETKDSTFEEALLSFADAYDGKCAYAGLALCYALEVKDNEEYEKKAQNIYEELLNSIADTDTTDIDTALKNLPFYIFAETNLGKKEHYQDVTVRSKALYKKLSENELSATDAAKFLFTMITTYENMSEQLFEHYMAVADMFKAALKSTYELILTGNETDRYLAAYAMNVAADMKVILKEKYEEQIEKLLA